MAKQKRRKRKYNYKLAWMLISPFILVGGFVLIIQHLPLKAPQESNLPDYVAEFFEKTAPVAQYYGKEYGIFPSVILAQAALESGYGRSKMAIEHNIYFNIKTQSDESIRVLAGEYYDGEHVMVDSSFKTYVSMEESFEDYAKMLNEHHIYKDVLNATTPKQAAHHLQEAGYATDPEYAEKLINIIDTYNLQQYDNNSAI